MGERVGGKHLLFQDGTPGETPLHIHRHLLGTQPWPGAGRSEKSKMKTLVLEKTQSNEVTAVSTNRYRRIYSTCTLVQVLGADSLRGGSS